MDSQTVEIVGRNYLISLLVRAGLEVARPERDRGVDLIAYLDLDEAGGNFVACPIQMKATSHRSFVLDRKYARFPSLLLVFVWRALDPDETRTYALTYSEAFDVGEAMGWTTTDSWQRRDRYETTRPSKRLVQLLDPYLVEANGWKRRVQAVAAEPVPGVPKQTHRRPLR